MITIAIVAASLEILGGHGVEAMLLRRALRDDGHTAFLVPINPRFPRGLGWLRRVRLLRTLVNEFIYVCSLPRLRNADVVHIFSASYWSFLLAPVPAMLAARALRKRVILHYHSGEADDHLAHWGWRVHPWLRCAHEIIVPSEYLRRVFAQHGYVARVIPNIVDLTRFRYQERPRVGPRLVSTRNLEPYYDVGTIVEAFAHIKARYQDAALTVAGSGSELRRLRALVERLRIDGVRFVGRVEPRHMPGLLSGADIFLNASVVDNQPVSILEACAAGLPVVSTPTGGLADLLSDGRNALVVPPRDPEAMAAAVAALVDRPGLALTLAKRARRDVDRHAWPAVRDAWYRAYAPVATQPALAARDTPPFRQVSS